jgi:hypothetical protein
MAFGTGVATVSFPVSAQAGKPYIGSNEGKVTVTGIASIDANSSVEVFIMGNDSTTDHNAIEHEIIDLKLTVENIVPGTGFDIVAISSQRLDGDFKVHYVWST